MKYILLAYIDRAGWEASDGVTDEDRAAIAHIIKVGQELEDSGELVYDVGLSVPTHTTSVYRHQGTVVATDGPFTEAKEALVCFHVVDCASHDRAVEIARRLVAGTGEIIEVRPLFDSSSGYDPASGEAL
jgi:hypothetical protein